MSGITKTVEFINKCGAFFIATVDENEQARVRPFSLIFEKDGKIYIGMGDHKDVYKQVVAHPRIELCSFDSAAGKWIRVTGKVVRDHSPEAVAKAFEIIPSLHDIYNEKSGLKMAMFYIDELHSVISSFTGKPDILV